MVTGFRGLILLAVVLGMPVASYFLVFRPQNIEITKARQEVEYTEQLLTKLRAEVARNADLEKAIKEIRAKYRSRFFDKSAKGKGGAIVEVWGQH